MIYDAIGWIVNSCPVQENIKVQKHSFVRPSQQLHSEGLVSSIHYPSAVQRNVNQAYLTIYGHFSASALDNNRASVSCLIYAANFQERQCISRLRI
jgi:hypothetical protein